MTARLPTFRFDLVCIAVMFAIAVGAASSGCSGTRAAYDAADTLDETAMVVSEHYAALLTEVNDLADQGAPESFVDRAQAIEARATPAVLALREASETYTAVGSADNAEALQAALNEAVPLVAELVSLVEER